MTAVGRGQPIFLGLTAILPTQLQIHQQLREVTISGCQESRNSTTLRDTLALADGRRPQR